MRCACCVMTSIRLTHLHTSDKNCHLLKSLLRDTTMQNKLSGSQPHVQQTGFKPGSCEAEARWLSLPGVKSRETNGLIANRNVI